MVDLSEINQLPRLQNLTLRVKPRCRLCCRLPAPYTHLLTRLDFTDHDVHDLSPLGQCAQLQSLCLSGCINVRMLDGLSPLSGLCELDVSLCFQLESLAPLSSCTTLRELRAGGCNQLTTLVCLPQLRVLDVSHCGTLADLSPIQGCPQLTDLDISHCKAVIRLCVSPGLMRLRAAGCTSLSDLAPLSGCGALQELDLSYCEAVSSLEDLWGSRCASSVQVLSLQGCESLSEISPLRGFRQLRDLDLSYCSVLSSLEPLQGADCCLCLERLDISYCFDLPGAGCGFYSANPRIGETLSFLSGCLRMRSLSLSGLGFELDYITTRPKHFASDLQCLRSLQQLQELYVDDHIIVGPGHPLAGGDRVAVKLRPWTSSAAT